MKNSTTTTMFQNGNTYTVKLEKATARKADREYITFDGSLHQVLSKIQTNEVTIQPEFERLVKPYDFKNA